MSDQTQEAITRTTVRLHDDDRDKLAYFAAKHDMSNNAYLAQALREKIERENGDYDLPTLEIARLHQITDEMRALTISVANLTTVVHRGFDALIGLTRGDSYLLDEGDDDRG